MVIREQDIAQSPHSNLTRSSIIFFYTVFVLNLLNIFYQMLAACSAPEEPDIQVAFQVLLIFHFFKLCLPDVKSTSPPD